MMGQISQEGPGMRFMNLAKLAAAVFAVFISTAAFAQNSARPFVGPAEAAETGMSALRGLAELVNGDYDPIVQRNTGFTPAPAAEQGNADLYVMSVTNTAIEIMLHVSGLQAGAAFSAPVYIIDGTQINNITIMSTSNNISVNGSYVQIISIPATAANNRVMAASLAYASGTVYSEPVRLPAQSAARDFNPASRPQSSGTYFSELVGGTAYAMLPNPHFLWVTSNIDAGRYYSALNVIGRNNLQTSYDHAWALWFGGADNLTKWTNAKPLPGTDFIEISFYMYNPTAVTVSNARVAMYGDVQIGDNDHAPIDPLRRGNLPTGELIGFVMSDRDATPRNSIAMVNLNAGKYGAETAPNEWGHWSGRSTAAAWDNNTVSTASQGYSTSIDSDAVVRVRNITVPAGALRVYTIHIGAGDAADIEEQIEVIVTPTDITGVPTETLAGVPLTLTGTVSPANATNQTITWSVVNAGTTGAAISGGNVLNTLAAGEVLVRATIDNGLGTGRNFEKDFVITVNLPCIVPVVNIAGVPNKTAAGIPLALTGTVVPVTTTNQAITWSVINAGAAGAVISSGDVLNTSAAGTVTIRATIHGGMADGTDYAKDFTINVSPMPVANIVGVPTETIIDIPLTLTGIVVSSDARNQSSSISWSITDTGTTGAAISDSVFNAPSAGTATVRATIVDGIAEGEDYTKDLTITVNPMMVTSIVGVPAETMAGITLTLTGIVTHYDEADQSAISWSVADMGTTGATINSGNELNTLSAGTVTIRATTPDAIADEADYFKDFVITVSPMPVANIVGVATEAVSGIPFTLTGVAVPASAANQSITWSMVTGVASIRNGNVLDAPLAGTVTVRATISNGIANGINYTKDFTITVNPKPAFNVNDLIYDLPAVTYNGRPQGIPAPTAAGCVSGLGGISVRYDGLASEPVNAGIYTVTADIAEGANYGAATELPLGNFTIIPKPLADMEFAVDTKVYDGSKAATMAPTPLTASVGVVDGDEVIFIIAGSEFASPNVGTAIPVTAELSLTGLSASNYFLASPPALSGSILPRDLTVSGAYVQTREYDGTATATVIGEFDVGGIVPGDEVVFIAANARFSTPNAGTDIPVDADMSLGGASASNYSLVLPSLAGDILPKPLAADALTPVAAQIYTGVGVTPQLTVMDGSKLLIPGEDYIAQYTDNVLIGDAAAITVLGTGNYTGEISGAFIIQRGRSARLFAGPSPARKRSDAINFYWQGYNFGTASLHIYDASGQLVATVAVSDPVFDNFDKRRIGSWDLTNNRGRHVASGAYLVRGVMVTANGKTEEVSLLIAVR